LISPFLCHSLISFSSQCDEGLICYLRDANEAVPGCIGGETDISMSDYCIVDPNFPVPTTSPTPPSPTPEPTAAPTTPAPTAAPTAKPTPEPIFGAIEYVGNEGTFYDVYPMRVCKGNSPFSHLKFIYS
jgi:hypothetical protein